MITYTHCQPAVYPSKERIKSIAMMPRMSGRRSKVNWMMLFSRRRKILKKDLLVPLDDLTNEPLDVDSKDPVSVNPTLLFTRLAAIAEREENVEQFFDYELNHQALSLFKNGLMRKPDKAALKKSLLPEKDATTMNVAQMQHVLDGGALLHRVPWSKGTRFDEVAKAYESYVRRHYGKARIVFDGYEDPMSIKASEHIRRPSKGSSRNINVIPDNNVPYSKERFLSNNHNKSQLIDLLKRSFQAEGHTVKVCRGDADALIVKDALECAERKDVVVVADDTDVAVMLLYHWKENLHDIYLLQENTGKCWSIKQSSNKIKDIKDHLLFIHAWSGCDSTSAIYNKGKTSFLNLVRKSKKMQSAAEMTQYLDRKIEDRRSLISIFVDFYTKYKQMLSDGWIEPEKLPPSERSAYYHGLRVYLQIMQWLLMDEDDTTFKPIEWGWNQSVGYLKPAKANGNRQTGSST
ncbi:uncharacterized protein [Clytia hemisphaerica]|uniref:uncharacterized protein n=1 Tax=Clytia hemisphaerica TaxID=252671 RepID=UPI0034D7135E